MIVTNANENGLYSEDKQQLSTRMLMRSKSTIKDTYEQAAGGATVMKIKDLNQELMKAAKINRVCWDYQVVTNSSCLESW